MTKTLPIDSYRFKVKRTKTFKQNTYLICIINKLFTSKKIFKYSNVTGTIVQLNSKEKSDHAPTYNIL